MSTKNQEYWRRRAKQNQKDWEQRCHETIEKRLSRYYAGALKAIKEDILQLYGEFAKENGIDFNEARRVLGSREFREWRMTIQEYLQRIAGGEVGLSRELRVLEARLRISPLEKLYSETLQELDKLGRSVDKSLRDFLSDAYTGNYRRNIFDLVKTGGLDVSIAKVDSHDVSRVLASRWSGKNFSKRVWNNTTLLSRNIRSAITNGVHRGLSVQQMSQMIEDKMHAGYSNAVRLVRTEMNFVNNQAHYDSMKDALSTTNSWQCLTIGQVNVAGRWTEKFFCWKSVTWGQTIRRCMHVAVRQSHRLLKESARQARGLRVTARAEILKYLPR